MGLMPPTFDGGFELPLITVLKTPESCGRPLMKSAEYSVDTAPAARFQHEKAPAVFQTHTGQQ